jgi:hypothetical protein
MDGAGFSNRSLSGACKGNFKVSKAFRALLATSSFSFVSYLFQSQILISLYISGFSVHVSPAEVAT